MLSKIVFFTFPGEIICGLGKTGEESGNEAKNYSFTSASNNRKVYQPIFKAALFEFNCILFKILRIKNIPKPH